MDENVILRLLFNKNITTKKKPATKENTTGRSYKYLFRVEIEPATRHGDRLFSGITHRYILLSL